MRYEIISESVCKLQAKECGELIHPEEREKFLRKLKFLPGEVEAKITRERIDRLIRDLGGEEVAYCNDYTKAPGVVVAYLQKYFAAELMLID